jgi:hypothetical protein
MRQENLIPAAAALGVFGFSENEKMAAQIYAVTGDKKLKSFLGAGGWNTGLIGKLKSNYASLKADRVTGPQLAARLQLQTGASLPVVNEFLKIVGGSVKLAPSILDKTTSFARGTVDTLKLVLLAAVAVGGVVLLTQLKGVLPNEKKA